MISDNDVVKLDQPTSAEAVNADIPPKQKLKPVPAQPAGVTQVGPGSQITSTAANVPTTLPQTGKGSNPGVALTPQVLTSSAGDGFGAGPSMPAAQPATTTALPAPATQTAGDSFASPVPASSGPTLTPTDPNNPLTAQTITPGQTADRFAIAQQRFDQFAKSTEPAYQSALRQANRMGAASGRLGSGSLRTDFGNLANQRNLQLDTGRDQFLTNALEGSIGDAWQGIGLAERQQGFQNQQQQQAFANELARLGFDENAINSAYGRALQTWMAGQQGGTGSNTAILGARDAAGQGQDALEALAGLIRARSAAPTQTGTATPPAGTIDPGTIYPWMGGGVNG